MNDENKMVRNAGCDELTAENVRHPRKVVPDTPESRARVEEALTEMRQSAESDAPTHTVIVLDASGTEIFRKVLVVPPSGGSNADDADITSPVEIALMMVAPEVCPYDCDRCRG